MKAVPKDFGITKNINKLTSTFYILVCFSVDVDQPMMIQFMLCANANNAHIWVNTDMKILAKSERGCCILFRKVAKVPSVIDSPMNGTTASTRSPSTKEKVQIRTHLQMETLTKISRNRNESHHFQMRMTCSTTCNVMTLGRTPKLPYTQREMNKTTCFQKNIWRC